MVKSIFGKVKAFQSISVTKYFCRSQNICPVFSRHSPACRAKPESKQQIRDAIEIKWKEKKEKILTLVSSSSSSPTTPMWSTSSSSTCKERDIFFGKFFRVDSQLFYRFVFSFHSICICLEKPAHLQGPPPRSRSQARCPQPESLSPD